MPESLLAGTSDLPRPFFNAARNYIALLQPQTNIVCQTEAKAYQEITTYKTAAERSNILEAFFFFFKATL